MPGLDGGQIEKRVHHAEHVFAGLMNDLRIALPSFEQHEVAATHQDFRVADDGIERRPQLVADGCKQFGPRVVGADGLATKRVAFFRIATMGRDVARDGDGRAGEIVAEPHAMDPHLDPDETAAVGCPIGLDAELRDSGRAAARRIAHRFQECGPVADEDACEQAAAVDGRRGRAEKFHRGAVRAQDGAIPVVPGDEIVEGVRGSHAAPRSGRDGDAPSDHRASRRQTGDAAICARRTMAATTTTPKTGHDT